MSLIILHFRQKSLYPPLINILSFFEENNIDYKIIGDYETKSSKFRFLSRLKLYLNYLRFIFHGLIALARSNKSVLYYESISAMPIVIYLFFFKNCKLRIFIHFHEYFSKEEYKRQSFLERLGRKHELSLFKKAEWISHTNKDRLELFKKDIDFNIKSSVLKIMPNYPSKSWIPANKNNLMKKDDKIRLLHIGSLSFGGMYLEEVLTQFGNNDKFEIHFYSHSKDVELIQTLKSYTSVYYHGSIQYNKIPDLMNKYDVGLVLYKGLSLNFTYNAPNKIFEYLAMDLDVWCSDKLLTAHHYANENTFPKVIMVNFDYLEEFNVNKAVERTGLKYKKSTYFYENVYVELAEKLKEIS